MNPFHVVVAAALLWPVAAFELPAQDVRFTGTLAASTCTVTASMVGGGGSGSADATVALRSVPVAGLDRAGRRPAGFRSGVEIQVGSVAQPCLASTVKPFFSGPNVNGAGRLSNAGTAHNVDIILIDANGPGADQDIHLATQASVRTVAIPSASGMVTLRYGAEYYATGVATAGTVIAEVQYELEYY